MQQRDEHRITDMMLKGYNSSYDYDIKLSSAPFLFFYFEPFRQCSFNNSKEVEKNSIFIFDCLFRWLPLDSIIYLCNVSNLSAGSSCSYKSTEYRVQYSTVQYSTVLYCTVHYSWRHCHTNSWHLTVVSSRSLSLIDKVLNFNLYCLSYLKSASTTSQSYQWCAILGLVNVEG